MIQQHRSTKKKQERQALFVGGGRYKFGQRHGAQRRALRQTLPGTWYNMAMLRLRLLKVDVTSSSGYTSKVSQFGQIHHLLIDHLLVDPNLPPGDVVKHPSVQRTSNPPWGYVSCAIRRPVQQHEVNHTSTNQELM